MNPVEKPKKAKLWKNSGGVAKKQKIKSEENDTTTPVKAELNLNSPIGRNKKWSHSKKLKPKVEESATGIQTPKNTKRKNEFQDSSSKKKAKPSNMTRKEWKILHLDKKDKSPAQSIKTEDSVETNPTIKPGNRNKRELKKFHMEQKGKEKQFEHKKFLKDLWEELRREDCKPEKKAQLLKQACEFLKGRVKEFTFAHDTVRVLECILSEGAENHRTLLYEELKGDILELTKAKYGKFFVLKMLRYGTKLQKDAIMKSFHGKVIKLIRHTVAAEVVELAFNECANATQRFELIQEFYGPTYKYFKTAEFRTLKELFEKEPDKKTVVIQHMKEELLKVLDKSVIKHSILHYVLWQFMINSDPASKAEVIESVRDVVPEILHTKDGSRVALHCIWFGTVKDRKMIIKAMRTFVTKIAKEEHGHMVLLAMFDCFDDTKFLKQRIIGELKTSMLELSQNIHGKKVLIYLLNPRDPHYIHPDVINILKTGDGNETSKKDPELRRSELKDAIAQPLLELIKSNIPNLYTDNAFCLFTLVVLQHTVGDKTEAFQSIADLAVEPYTTENKNTHPIEHPGSNFLFKQLIVREKNGSTTDNVTFSEILVKTVPTFVFNSWKECNRGAFLLVSLLETELPSVVQRIKEELTGFKKYLTKKPFKGAEILLKKLKE